MKSKLIISVFQPVKLSLSILTVSKNCACVKFGGGRVYIVLDNLLSKYVIVRYFEQHCADMGLM